MTVDPQNLRPLGTRIIVRKYELPEKIGSIHVPEAWRGDRSLQVFEVVKTTEKANAALGIELTPDDIVETRRSWEMVSHPQLPEDHYFLNAEDVASIYPWNEEESDEQN